MKDGDDVIDCMKMHTLRAWVYSVSVFVFLKMKGFKTGSI